MEKKPKRLVLRATPVICLLSLLLLFSDFHSSRFLHVHQRKDDQYSTTRICDDHDSWLMSREVDVTVGKHESQLTSRGDRKTLDEHEPELSSRAANKAEEPEAHVTSRKDESQLTSREDGETSDKHESKLSSRVVNKAEEPEARVTSRKDDSQLTSREVGKSSDKHEPGLSSGLMNKALKEPESQNSSGKASESADENESQLSNKEVNITAVEQESHLSSKEVTKTGKQPESQVSRRKANKTVDEKAFQPLIREVNHKVDQHEPMQSPLARLVRGEDQKKLETTGFACDRAAFSLVCVADKPVRIDTNTMKLYVPTDQTAQHENTEVRPYARQDDVDLLQHITPVHILQGNATPPACQYTHNAPAVIFSSGGFTGNLFHEFNEIIIPLFLTTLHLQSRALFIVIDYKPSFVNKYSKIMSRLSLYKVINPAADRKVHCFPGAVVGLKYHDNLALNSSDIPGGYSMSDFRQFLWKTYSLKIMNVSQIGKPVLMLVSRLGTRRFLNEGEMVTMMRELGFKVIVVKRPDRMSNLNKFTRVVNKCSVLVGTHGAGLANELFLPTGGVMVQVEGLGLEWASTFYYGNPAAAMGVHYLRYKIEPDESSLLGKYGRNHPIITDPASIFAQGYQAARAAYLDQQNIKVNISRFRETLTEALRLLGRSAPLHSHL